MKTPSSLSHTLKKELLNRRLFTIAFPTALVYALLTLYLFDYRLLLQTWLGNYPLAYKFSLMAALLQGFQTLFSPVDKWLLSATSLFVGINVMLALSNMQRIKERGKITVSVGGASILGIATAGCTTCGISLFALFGISSAISSLPFHGLELHVLAFILLVGSCGYMLKKLHEEVYCKTPQTKRVTR